MKRFMNKKVAVVGVAVALVLGVGGAAFAYFTSTGSGTGSAQVGTASNLTITQLGTPGYNSLASTYNQDQSYNDPNLMQFGNDITLANPGYQNLVSAVVAMRNWGPAITDIPITLSIYGPSPSAGVLGSLVTSVTQDFSFAAAPVTNQTPAGFENITFDFPQGTFVPQEFVYGIGYAGINATDPGYLLNVAMSSSGGVGNTPGNDLTVGTDTTPGTVWVETSNNSSLGNDFPTCTTTPPVTTGVFEQVITDCGPDNTNNLGAYGTPAQVFAGNADIPAVEFNVNSLTDLYPDNTAHIINFSVTNPGTGNVYVNGVTISISSITQTPASISAYGAGSCLSSWFQFVQPQAPVDTEIVPGTTDYNGDASITMIDEPGNQDACEGATVNLSFATT